MHTEISQTTREALRNLFQILDIDGETFDERLFQLATMAFMGKAEFDVGRKTLLKHAKRGLGKQPRKKIEVKRETAERLEELFHRMYPYMEWQSWNWWVVDLMDFVDAALREKEAEEGLNKRKKKDIAHDNDG